MSFSTASSSTIPTRSRKERQRERCDSWRRKQNDRFIAEMDRLRNERFSNLSLYELSPTGPPRQLPSAQFVNVTSDDDCNCEVCLDTLSSTVTIPLPISTMPLQLATQNFYGSMIDVVENIEDVCTLGQFNRTVQLQLLNKVYPPEVSVLVSECEDNESSPVEVSVLTPTESGDIKSPLADTDITSVEIELPFLLQHIVDSAVSFEIPTSRLPNGAVVRTHNVQEKPVNKVIFKPEIIEASKLKLDSVIRNRYNSIFDYTNPDVGSSIGSVSVGTGVPFHPSDAAATAKLLALIPDDAHHHWKIGDKRPQCSPEMYYLLYGPTLSFECERRTDIRDPPPDWCYMYYRLTGSTNLHHLSLYRVFSGTDVRRIFDANFRRIMERSKVQKIFRDARDVPLNSERTLFLKY